MENVAHLKMGLKILAGNAHSAEAAILPGAAWHLVGDMTIIPAEAYCNLDVALADGQTAEDACAKIRAHLDSHGASDVGVWVL